MLGVCLLGVVCLFARCLFVEHLENHTLSGGTYLYSKNNPALIILRTVLGSRTSPALLATMTAAAIVILSITMHSRLILLVLIVEFFSGIVLSIVYWFLSRFRVDILF